MPRTIERNIFAGVAAALVVLLVIATVALWHVSNVREARVLGFVALLGSLAFSLLLGAVWLLLRRDLRARRPVVEALRESEELNARIFEGSADAMAVLDGCGRLKSVNSAMWRWLEAVGSQPVENMQWADTWPGELGKICAAAVETVKAGRVVEFEGRCHLRSGEIRCYQVTLTPVRDPEGKVERILVASRDETESRSGEGKFRVVFDNAPSPHFIIDQERILDCNHAAVEMLKCPTKLGIIGRNVDEFSPEHQPDGSRSPEKRAEIWRLAHDVGQFRYEWQARRSTGEEFPIEVLLTPAAMEGRPVLLAVWRDLSERRFAERALHEAEQRFQAFMDHSPTPWFMKDDQGRMVFINQVMADAFGVKVADIVGKTDFDWLPVETARVVRENDRRILEQNRAVQQVEMITTGDGGTHEWLVVKFPIEVAGGRKFLGGIGVDVKRQRNAERALKQSEAVFRDLFDDAPVAYHELDTEGRVLRVNKTELSLLGYSADEMIGRPIWDFVVDSVSKEAVLAKLKSGGEVGEVFQRTYIRKDGSLIPVLIRDRLIRGASGEICGLRSTMQDMSDLVRTEESLRHAEAKYRKIFENATEGIFQIAPDGRYLDANPALASILGYSSAKDLLETVTDVGCQVYVDPARHAEFRAAMDRDGSLTDFQSQVYRKDGSVIWVSEHAMAVRDREGRILYYEGAMEDIMARRQAESAMAEARDAAIESARLKTEFLANMSHEIRTPMNGIIGMTGLLLDTELSQRQRDFAETIADSSEALLKIINDVLDFSKIEAGMLTFEEIDFELSEVLEGVLDLFSGRALSKGVELSLIVSQDVPEHLSGDPGRLRQVLTNLVGNALKFTEKGEVRINVKLTAGAAGGKRLRFEIADTGIGISDEQQERLFQAFVQADGSTTRRYGGTGLGLAISRRLVSGMGGEIGVESVSGAGSVFWFTAVFGEQAGLPERRIPCFEGLRFLIMDDSPTTRAALLHSIPDSGAALVEASEAEEALRLLSDSASAGKPFNVAFLDAEVRCPGGESVLRAIRADSRFADLKLVRIVSLNFSEEPEPGDEVAWDGHVTKPLKPRDVRRCLEAVLGGVHLPQSIQPAAGLQPVAKTVSRRGTPLRVLVAEDSLVSQKVVHFQLGKLGCIVDSVVDGEAAVAAAMKTEYDVILMDCQMPLLDGFETTRRIRDTEAGGRHRAWIIAMTAHSLIGDRDRCIEAGMDDYLSKPVRIADLAEALQRSPASAPAARQEPEPSWTTAVSRETLDGFRELELESGRSILGGVIDLFIETTPPVFQEARLALERNDAPRLARFAHNLKGSCSNFGAHRMRDACERLESIAMRGNLAGAVESLDEAEREFGLVRIALENELVEKAS